MIALFLIKNSQTLYNFCQDKKLRVVSIVLNNLNDIEVKLQLDTSRYYGSELPSLEVCSKVHSLYFVGTTPRTLNDMNNLFDYENGTSNGSGLKENYKDFHNNIKTGGL